MKFDCHNPHKVFAQYLALSRHTINIAPYYRSPRPVKGFALCLWPLNFISPFNEALFPLGTT